MSALSVQRIDRRGITFVGGVAGLGMNVTQHGSKSWILCYQVGGKRRGMGLGGYPDVTLAAAKEAARAARAKLSQGIDPIQDARERRSALVAAQASAITFAKDAPRGERFTDMEARAEDEEEGRRARATYNRPGWRTTSGGRTEFLIDPAVFHSEVCAGFEPAHVCRMLAEKGCLKSGEEAGKVRFSLHRTTPESRQSRRYYVVTDAIWEE